MLNDNAKASLGGGLYKYRLEITNKPSGKPMPEATVSAYF
jgi:hypothetical protein